jgi:SNF2 family DNA or RNA helicase
VPWETLLTSFSRLLGIVDESAANTRKVAIFSSFRDVLTTVAGVLDGRAVLLAQIQAGGVGLNIQSASVAVICEPQVKPTLEEQAIARLHRTGRRSS